MYTGPETEANSLRKLFNDSISESEAWRYVELLLNSLDVAVFWKDAQSRYVAGNAAFAKAAGIPLCKISGKLDDEMPWTLEHGPASRDPDGPIVATDEPVLRDRRQIRLSDGELHRVAVNVVPIVSDSGEAVGVFGSFRDICEHADTVTDQQRQLINLENQVLATRNELVRTNDSMRREVEERGRLHAQQHQLSEYAEAMRDTLAELTETENEEGVLDAVIAGALRLLPADLIAIVLPGIDGKLEIVRQHLSCCYSIDPVAASPERLRDLVGTPSSNSSPTLNERSLGPAASAIVMPMRVGGRDVGYLTVESRIRNLYDDSHTERLHTLAASAAAIVANRQLAQQASMVGAARERDRLARSLHESLSQTIWSLSVTAESGVASAATHKEATRVLERIQSLTQEAKVAMRALLSNEEFSLVGGPELHIAIRNLVRTSFSDAGPAVTLELEPLDLAPERATGLFRIMQEALNNIARHANATTIHVSMHNTEQPLIQINDNGDGFETDLVLPGHMGLEIIRRRSAEIGGVLDLRSVPGVGTSLTITLVR